MATESTWHENFKREALNKEVHDTLISEKFGGSANRLMRTEQAEKILRSRMNPLSALIHGVTIARELNISVFELAAESIRRGPKRAFDMLSMASMQHYNRLSFEGDVRRGTIHAGQSVGLVHDIPDVAEIIRRIVVEAQEAMTRLHSTGINTTSTGEVLKV